MIHTIMAVYDDKAEAFAQPYFVANLVVGQRAFVGAAQDKDSLLYRFPEDYRLYNLGTFDDVTGAFVSLERPELVMTASQAREPILTGVDAPIVQALS